MFVAARVMAPEGVLQPRKMVKAGPRDTCGTLLSTLLENAALLKDYNISSILAFTDVRESEENQIKLDANDDISNVIDLGYKFVLYNMSKKEPPSPAIKRGKAGAKINGENQANTASLKKKAEEEPSVRQLPTAGSPLPSEVVDSLHFECICGHSVLHSMKVSHEKYCAAIRNLKKEGSIRRGGESVAVRAALAQVPEEPLKTESAQDRFTCECGSRFDKTAEFNDHCADCDVASGSMLRCVCGRLYINSATYRIHKELCPKCRRCARVPGFSAFSSKMFMCCCGETFLVKSQLLNHQLLCENSEAISEMSCSCGVVIAQPWNLNIHKRTCSVANGGGNSTKIGSALQSSNIKDESISVQDRKRGGGVSDKVKKRPAGGRESPVSTSRGEVEASPLAEDKFEQIKLRRSKASDSLTQTKAFKPQGGSGPLKLPNENQPKKKRKKTENEIQFEVEMILLHVGEVSKLDNLHFLIRWKGYDSSEDCWLPYDECRDLKALDEYCALHTELAPLLSKED